MSLFELLIVLAIILIIFGPKQLPKLADVMGESIQRFKKGMNKKDMEADEMEKDTQNE